VLDSGSVGLRTNVARTAARGVMRKFCYGLGVVVSLFLVGGAIGLFARNGTLLDAESKAYLNDSMVAITAHWDTDELWKRSTPHFRETANRDALRGLFKAAGAALGPLVEYRGANGEAVISSMNAGGMVSASYVAKGRFQRGDADFRIAMIKVGDTWLIEGFHVGSPALMKTLVGLRS
jgi:hypothetical protein